MALNTLKNTSWQCVERLGQHIDVVSQSGSIPEPSVGEARLHMVATSVCGADLRIASGNKDTSRQMQEPVIMGHEGCGIIEHLHPDQHHSSLRSGDFVVVLPHIHMAPSLTDGCQHSTSCIHAACTSRHHTRHAGWDFNGVFTEYGIFPLENLVPVSPEHLSVVETSPLGSALYTVTEPMLCCLSAYPLMEQEEQALRDRPLHPGRALVIGCGPIGTMHSMLLAERGYDVWLYDPIPQRMHLTQHCLSGGKEYDPIHFPNGGQFDLVMVTANVLSAIHLGEFAVKDNGILYLFAGLNTSDRQAMHPDGIFPYERVHRLASGVLVRTNGKRVLYIGHSGYDAQLAPLAIATVAANKDRLDRLITGIIPDWTSPLIQSHLPGLDNWRTPDGEPAIIAVLKGTADLRHHGKILIRASAR
jgi:threonine dehydrogenase-like Zn-dependent dehydrogenase